MSSPAALPLTPEMEAAAREAVDRAHLRILEYIYYAAGGFTILCVSFLIFHFSICLFIGLNPHLFDNSSHHGTQANPPPPAFLLIVAAVIGLIMVLGWIFGAFQIWAGRCVKHRRHRVAIMIVAAVECLFLPWGTALGVCTFLCLERPSVRALFP